MKKFRDRPWYSLAVSICIGVILFVVLIRIGSIFDGIATFIGFFSTVFLGAVIAYIINPLGKLYRDKLFCKLKKEGVKTALGNMLAFVTVIIFLVIFGLTVVPQMIESIKLFASNLDGYAAGLQKTLVAFGVSSNINAADGLASPATGFMPAPSSRCRQVKAPNPSSYSGSAAFAFKR